MNFQVIPREKWIPDSGRDVAYLKIDNWNDHAFNTSFMLHYFDEESREYEVGFLKIGYIGQHEGQHTSKKIPTHFESLDDNFFTLGQTESFYKTIFELGDKGQKILNALNDIVNNRAIIESIQDEKVFSVSLLRNMSLGVVEEQFGRALNGQVPLSNFHFRFAREKSDDLGAINLDFEVNRKSNPPSNIHAIIGRNGSGKTTLLNGMVEAIINQNSLLGKFLDCDQYDFEISRNYFGRVVSVAFSAFDPFTPPSDQNDPAKGPCYTYIGLKNRDEDGRNLRVEELHKGCVSSLIDCFYDTGAQGKASRWFDALEKLSSDNNFSDMNLPSIYDIFKSLEHQFLDLDHDEKTELFYENLKDIFKTMSTGHAIVFITITRLVATVELKTLVLLDEPESHLHPPLLSSFIRALSDLLIEQNGVAILATHSPVVLQEIPKSCVWRVDRSGFTTSVDRPRFETFAENVGSLTRDVFTLELSKSGFYSIFKELIASGKNYEEIINLFGNNLGIEGRAILLSMIPDDDGELTNDKIR